MARSISSSSPLQILTDGGRSAAIARLTLAAAAPGQSAASIPA